MKRRWIGVLLILIALVLFALVITRAQVYEEKSEYIVGDKYVGPTLDVYSVTGEGIGTFNITLFPSRIGYSVYVGIANTTISNGDLELWVVNPEGLDQLQKFVEGRGQLPSRVYAVKYNITGPIDFKLADPTLGYDSLNYDGNYVFAFIYYAPTDFDMIKVMLNIMQRWLVPQPWNPTIIDYSMIVSGVILVSLGLYLTWRNPSLSRKEKRKLGHRKTA